MMELIDKAKNVAEKGCPLAPINRNGKIKRERER